MQGSRWRQVTIAVLIAICLLGGESNRAAIATDGIIAEFSIPAGGDFVTLPVSLNGKSYDFILDTSRAYSTFDTSLRVPLEMNHVDARVYEASGIDPQIDLFEAPEGKIGPIAVSFPPGVKLRDFSSARKETWLNHHGVLALHAFRSLILQIDFEKGKVRFLSSVPEGAGVALPFAHGKRSKESSAQVIGRLGSDVSDKFRIATAFTGSIGLTPELFINCEENGGIKESRRVHVLLASGYEKSMSGIVEDFEVDGLRGTPQVVHATPVNLIGLEYLSEFVVTFDFPNEVVYLRPQSKRDIDSSGFVREVGVSLHRNRDLISIAHVKGGSLADQSGLQTGDIVEKVDGRAIPSGSSWHAGRLLRRVWGRAPLQIQRGDDHLTIATKDAKAP